MAVHDTLRAVFNVKVQNVSRIREDIREYLASNPRASAPEVAGAVGCSRATVRATAKELGLTLRHGNRADATPLGQQLGPMRLAIDEAMRGPLVVSIVRELVNQWLATKAPTLAPTDEQVSKALATEAGIDNIATALRTQGYAGIYSALHRNHSEIVRRALHTPVEIVEERSDPATLGVRFSYVLGDPRGDVMVRAMLEAFGQAGRRVFGEWAHMAVTKIAEEKAAAEGSQ